MFGGLAGGPVDDPVSKDSALGRGANEWRLHITLQNSSEAFRSFSMFRTPGLPVSLSEEGLRSSSCTNSWDASDSDVLGITSQEISTQKSGMCRAGPDLTRLAQATM